MAKFIEQKIEITISKMFKNSETLFNPLTEDQVSSLEEIVTELAGDGCIIEVSKPE